jgi:hypothetical protein
MNCPYILRLLFINLKPAVRYPLKYTLTKKTYTFDIQKGRVSPLIPDP